jgi:hypothetical protein
VAPTAGLGVKLVATNDTQLTLDASTGVIWGKDTLGSLDTSGAGVAGQKLTQKLSGTASLTESWRGSGRRGTSRMRSTRSARA